MLDYFEVLMGLVVVLLLFQLFSFAMLLWCLHDIERRLMDLSTCFFSEVRATKAMFEARYKEQGAAIYMSGIECKKEVGDG